MADLTNIQIDGKKYPFMGTLTQESPIQIYKGKDLKNTTWNDIKNDILAANSGTLDLRTKYREGDYKEITFSIEGGAERTMKVIIMGIDTYIGAHGIQHHIDWIGERVLDWGDSTHWFYTQTLTSFDECAYMDTWGKYSLNNRIYPCLPSDLRAVIANKSNYLDKVKINDLANGIVASGKVWKNMGKLWMPTEYELFGKTIFGTKYSNGASRQYQLFNENLNHLRLKHFDENVSDINGGTYNYWLATPSKISSEVCYVQVYPDNIPHVRTTSYNTRGNVYLPLCFRVA